jgi:hypothetical protein
MGGPLLSEPVFAPRRGALDMGGDSLSDSCANQARCSGVAPAGRLSGASLGGSEIEALYTDLVLTHRGRCGRGLGPDCTPRFPNRTHDRGHDLAAAVRDL